MAKARALNTEQEAPGSVRMVRGLKDVVTPPLAFIGIVGDISQPGKIMSLYFLQIQLLPGGFRVASQLETLPSDLSLGLTRDGSLSKRKLTRNLYDICRDGLNHPWPYRTSRDLGYIITEAHFARTLYIRASFEDTQPVFPPSHLTSLHTKVTADTNIHTEYRLSHHIYLIQQRFFYLCVDRYHNQYQLTKKTVSIS
ncbi:uncharacterized protein CLUP02_00813 [Colletotrichum lupini]|uniref:Uncharacterized protein n=1 Tax=Colletotrichum lupini TaxID=145971 RepID=A0A9Q8W9B6_9PEZI|nr:uncharacterized protein CLUP02_00813 [Colletotrichum lupini]UQC74165.1 hypothetical protein CLUP02_00813 [Colletotrichum lupini]